MTIQAFPSWALADVPTRAGLVYARGQALLPVGGGAVDATGALTGGAWLLDFNRLPLLTDGRRVLRLVGLGAGVVGRRFISGALPVGGPGAVPAATVFGLAPGVALRLVDAVFYCDAAGATGTLDPGGVVGLPFSAANPLRLPSYPMGAADTITAGGGGPSVLYAGAGVDDDAELAAASVTIRPWISDWTGAAPAAPVRYDAPDYAPMLGRCGRNADPVVYPYAPERPLYVRNDQAFGVRIDSNGVIADPITVRILAVLAVWSE